MVKVLFEVNTGVYFGWGAPINFLNRNRGFEALKSAYLKPLAKYRGEIFCYGEFKIIKLTRDTFSGPEIGRFLPISLRLLVVGRGKQCDKVKEEPWAKIFIQPSNNYKGIKFKIQTEPNSLIWEDFIELLF